MVRRLVTLFYAFLLFLGGLPLLPNRVENAREPHEVVRHNILCVFFHLTTIPSYTILRASSGQSTIKREGHHSSQKGENT